MSVIADPWVENRVEEIDGEVREEVHEDQEHGDADDRRTVLELDGPEQRSADARDVEDALSDDRATHERAEVDGEERHDRDEAVGQHVPPHHLFTAESL